MNGEKSMIDLNTNALCTEYEIKEFDGTLAEGDLDSIRAVINRMSVMFENYCNRKFVSQTFTEYYNGTGDRYLYLDNYPVTEITSVHEDPDWDWGSDELIESTEYRIIDDMGIVYQSIFPKGHQNIKVIYTAGYTTVPEDLKQVCIEEVIRAFKKKNRIDQLLITKEDGTSNYFFDTLLPKTKLVLDMYRKKFF